ncbi:MAG: thiamine phosphate synthase [Betaproteobacteria bacterium]|nr:thiamine phosphate synthase [Betaproteobacteria bacterium]
MQQSAPATAHGARGPRARQPVSRPPVHGLYAITPDDADTARLIIRVRAALEGGAAVVQYRNKSADSALRHVQAGALAILCRQHGVPLIVNDHLELALTIDADGLHLGAADGDIAAARRALGAGRLLGVSCYNRFDLALAARDAGADHIAFGAAFVSLTKPDAVHAPLALYRRAQAELGLAIVAIGGINADNAADVIGAGADAIAVITALFGAADIAAAARRLRSLFPTT